MDPDVIEDFKSALKRVEGLGERASDFLSSSDLGNEAQLTLDDLEYWCDRLRRVTTDILFGVEEE